MKSDLIKQTTPKSASSGWFLLEDPTCTSASKRICACWPLGKRTGNKPLVNKPCKQPLTCGVFSKGLQRFIISQTKSIGSEFKQNISRNFAFGRHFVHDKDPRLDVAAKPANTCHCVASGQGSNVNNDIRYPELK